MKEYIKPEILVEDINVENIMEVSKQGQFSNWEAGQNVDFSDLW